MNSWVQAYIDLRIYWDLGLGLNCQALGVTGTEKEEYSMAKTQRRADERRRRSKYPQSKCRCWVMLPWQPVFPDIMQGEWYWRKSHYDRRGKGGGGRGLRILSQGHSERRVILMMILMGSNGGSDRHRPTHPSLKSLWKLTRTHKRAHTHTHIWLHAQ